MQKTGYTQTLYELKHLNPSIIQIFITQQHLLIRIFVQSVQKKGRQLQN